MTIWSWNNSLQFDEKQSPAGLFQRAIFLLHLVSVLSANDFLQYHFGHHAVGKAVGEFDGVVAASRHLAPCDDGNRFEAVFFDYGEVGVVVFGSLLPIA